MQPTYKPEATIRITVETTTGVSALLNTALTLFLSLYCWASRSNNAHVTMETQF
jgi:hypothetical protein